MTAEELSNTADVFVIPDAAPQTLSEAAAQAQAAVESLPRRRPGRPRGSRVIDGKVVAPTNVDVNMPEGTGSRRRAGTRKRSEPVSPQDIVDVLLFGHDAASMILGPAAKMSEEDAKKIAARAAVVAEDFGIEVAGRIAHVVLLLAATVSIEAPIIFRVMLAQQAAAAARRSGQTTFTGGVVQEPTAEVPVVKSTGGSVDPNEISRILGIATGSPNGVGN